MHDRWVTQFLRGGSAFVPRNRDGVGDQLMILFASGDEAAIDTTVRTFLKRVVRFFGKDLAEVRKIYGQVIGRKYHVPLPLTKELTLVSFKVRRPIGRQGAYGWFVAERILGIQRVSAATSVIYLPGRHRVTCLQSAESCEERRRHAQMVRQHFVRMHQYPLTAQAWPPFGAGPWRSDR